MPTPDEAMAGRGKNMVPYNEKVDIWAVGVLVFELLSGRPPFEVEDPKETAKLILAAKVPELPSTVSAAAEDFIKLALQKKPTQRPSASELLQHPWVSSWAAELGQRFSLRTAARTLQERLNMSWWVPCLQPNLHIVYPRVQGC